MIRALIFDLDNTLIDRQRAFSEMLERYDESEKLSKETFLNRLADAENNGSYGERYYPLG